VIEFGEVADWGDPGEFKAGLVGCLLYSRRDLACAVQWMRTRSVSANGRRSNRVRICRNVACYVSGPLQLTSC
jgi:hypothetical protein